MRSTTSWRNSGLSAEKYAVNPVTRTIRFGYAEGSSLAARIWSLSTMFTLTSVPPISKCPFNTAATFSMAFSRSMMVSLSSSWNGAVLPYPGWTAAIALAAAVNAPSFRNPLFGFAPWLIGSQALRPLGVAPTCFPKGTVFAHENRPGIVRCPSGVRS